MTNKNLERAISQILAKKKECKDSGYMMSDDFLLGLYAGLDKALRILLKECGKNENLDNGCSIETFHL